MTVGEHVKTMLELDQNSQIMFVTRTDTPYIYVVANLPDGKRVAAELPTGISKEKA